ncbi:MAG: lycopene cyclase family protein [Planctomycetota bacterium]
MQLERADIVVIGGGCAGLSVAVQLAAQASGRGLQSRSLIILEERSAYKRDRTWCGWSLEPHVFQSCVDHSWHRWKGTLAGEHAIHEWREHAYEHIRADRFYAEAEARIAGAGHADLRMGVRVQALTATGGGFEVTTDQGSLSARVVVDTRPVRSGLEEGGLLQHFGGFEVSAKDAVFDPDTVTLMDFDVDQRGGIHFMYVLPFSSSRALVESTFISGSPHDSDVYRDHVMDYVESRLGTEVESVSYVELGVIPMQPVPRYSPTPGLYRAGGPGGAVKASTGYGFHQIQRQACVLAARLLDERGSPLAPSRPGVDEWMDRVFLGFLRSNPDRAPEIFHRLLRALSAESLARFLMGRATARDRLRMIAAMPKIPFVREAVRELAS